MQPEMNLESGDLVILHCAGWEGEVGIVTQPIAPGFPGHVLVYQDGAISGVPVTIGEVEPAGENSEGFAQLGYQLIKLGSLVIEQKLIVYRA